ncbi:TonB-dependent receptor plug domain-containing protein [Pedobacter punctiformis]|uniref:TonB-dependent receptor n=1 Tax=Pedobacter punctiformis TaxID=3004097 RepID=A0ABT4L6S6_9SPHI|nr:TonB-dependent receptor [Pedobacter sp. HCMS5-2]MCZ4243625.1 TonB-dependent receptor [Pedobacter sp. HCMS5-2]
MKIYLSIAFVLSGFVALGQDVRVDTAKANDLKDVVITGQFGPQSLKNSVYNVRTINSEKIRLRAATNVQQILNTELGFRFSNDLTLGTTDVQLMGMSGRNIKILLDGVPMIDRSDTRESLNQIDINTIDRIEIIEGPMSVVYGSDALAGVINIITKGASKALLNLAARIQEETAGNEYAAFSGKGQHMQNVTGSWQNKGWSALAGFTHNDFSGWNLASKTATIDEVESETNRWKPKEQWLGNTKIGYRNENFNIWYRLDGLNETIDVRGGINPNNYKAKFQSYTTNRYTQQIQSEWRLNPKLRFTAIAGYTNLKRGTRTVIHDFTTSTEALTDAPGEQDVAKFNSTIFRTTAQYVPNPYISFQPGFEFNRDAASGARIAGTPVINDYAFFLSSEIKPAKGINIRPGIRVIKNSVYDAPLVPSLNTKFSLTKNLDLRLSYARGFRAPALRELYYDFVDASHNIYGNPNLKAEQSNSFNGSLAWAGIQEKDLQFRSTLSGFYTQYKNRIIFAFDPQNSQITTLLNVSKSKTTGGTLENTLVFKNVQASLGFSYIGNYNEILEDVPSLDIPDFVWSAEINANVTYSFSEINGTISIFYKYVGKKPSYQLSTANNSQSATLGEVGAFNLADLMISKKLYKGLNINAGVKNLFNVTQLTNTSTATGGAHSTGGTSVPYTYGRSYILGLTYNWSKF